MARPRPLAVEVSEIVLLPDLDRNNVPGNAAKLCLISPHWFPVSRFHFPHTRGELPEEPYAKGSSEARFGTHSPSGDSRSSTRCCQPGRVHSALFVRTRLCEEPSEDGHGSRSSANEREPNLAGNLAIQHPVKIQRGYRDKICIACQQTGFRKGIIWHSIVLTDPSILERMNQNWDWIAVNIACFLYPRYLARYSVLVTVTKLPGT